MTTDPTTAIRQKAGSFPDTIRGTPCNQESFKVGKTAFLYIGPGAKGEGFKAMFKLASSMAQAEKLAAEQPDRFGVGSAGWVSVRFSVEKPLAKSIWEKWLAESYALARPAKQAGQRPRTAKKATRKR
ncbi:MAG: MmcQ/YjbR family DNA-binding protein [Planctomycetes bacterium]|nr:MmcQ/YjbR family DNA-binding protein [Planctomycetota bacterium]MCB9888077.1 MmcQ/YjbR family DNA-binding protein [Planctomycetota bacterium]